MTLFWKMSNCNEHDVFYFILYFAPIVKENINIEH